MDEPENNSEKKYIEITAEDYEVALATKVISKAYKMISGVMFLIVIAVGLLGWKFSADINKKKTDIENLEAGLKESLESYKDLQSSLQLEIQKLTGEKQLLEAYIRDINSNFQNTSKSMTDAFLSASLTSQKQLVQIEDEVADQLATYQDTVISISAQIKAAKAKLNSIDNSKNQVDGVLTEVKQMENSINKRFEKILESYNKQIVAIDFRESKFLHLIGLRAYFRENDSKWKKNARNGYLTIKDSNGKEYIDQPIREANSFQMSYNGKSFQINVTSSFSDENVVLEIERIN